MQELLKNAWQGWENYNDNGKYAVLLLAALLFLWFRKEPIKGKSLLLYTTIMTICCILPVSAVFLMKYQTGFYGYEWVWNYVPVILMIAYGGTVFWAGEWEKTKKVGKEHGKRDAVIIALLGVAVIALCGRMGQPVFSPEVADEEQELVRSTLQTIADEAGDEEICLWAPKEVMALARATQGDICLVYGRNMWDASLGAYFYEPYTEKEESLYLWMNQAEEQGVAADGAEYVEAAVSAGVNRILLPGNVNQEDIAQLENALGEEAVLLNGYYYFAL